MNWERKRGEREYVEIENRIEVTWMINRNSFVFLRLLEFAFFAAFYPARCNEVFWVWETGENVQMFAFKWRGRQ